eukprot:TRINITY_DN10975_c0_g1_i1.p1 TRINITY_DN10975_c0_g1~~TRINITY_DN10975_c0_g1_i1.p1  ORF type:complete len:215 (+),score=40.04 TRINITY_DN10975_c0_g1_i1:31-645(+)
MTDITKILKGVILGDHVGKSQILSRIQNNTFSQDDQPTIGVSFGIKVQDQVKLQLWDTSSNPAFNSIRDSYIRGMALYIFVYDITNEDSLEWLHSVTDIVSLSYSPESVLLLVGNKLDERHQQKVTSAMVDAFIQEMPFERVDRIEVSAKTGENVDALVDMMIRLSGDNPGSFNWDELDSDDFDFNVQPSITERILSFVRDLFT